MTLWPKTNTAKKAVSSGRDKIVHSLDSEEVLGILIPNGASARGSLA
jgi:hypothetical protein